MTKQMVVPMEAGKLLSLLEDAGYKAYLVGGCVRDSLMGRTPHDYDIATNARPEQVMDIMSGKYRVEGTGLKHGTVTVYVDGMHLEVTTFRVEGAYTDGRHPDSVEFVSDLTADLARRDFTVNAIAYSPTEGYIDPFGGMQDIEALLIRAVGDPEERFQEDHLRILRALRFTSTLSRNAHGGQFLIEADTVRAIQKMYRLLSTVSKERITTEMTKLLGGKNVRNVLLCYPYVFYSLYPELEPMYRQVQHHPWHKYNLWEHVAAVVENVEPKIECLLWAAFLHDCGKPAVAFTAPVKHMKLQAAKSHAQLDDYEHEDVTSFIGHADAGANLAAKVLERTSIKKSVQQRIVELIRGHHSFPSNKIKSVRRWMANHEGSYCAQALKLRLADSRGFSDYGAAIAEREVHEISVLMQQVQDGMVPYQANKLACCGEDIMKLGVEEGPKIGMILKSLFSAVLEEKVANEKAALIAYVKETLL